MNDETQTDAPERCPICGSPEPCSHDFDALNQQLATLGATLGTKATPCWDDKLTTDSHR
jgi:hypothetical protein